MTEQTGGRHLGRLLDGIFAGQERVTSEEIRRRAVAADLPAEVQVRLDGLPEGEYAQDEVAEALGVQDETS